MRLALLLLLLGSTAQAQEFNQYSPQRAFAEACHFSRYNCRGLSTPMVRYSIYVESEGAYGIYMGGNTVWLSPELDTPEKRYLIMVHEMVHYLQSMRDGNGVPFNGTFERCVYEQEAFEISDIVAARLKLYDMIRPGILILYGCDS